MPEGQRARPQPTPETTHFWEGTRAGELRLQRCNSCGKTYFPPRPFCPACASRDVSVFKASGKAILDTYVIHHRKVAGFEPPYAIAVVELAEGPRMMTNIVECPQTPEALRLDSPGSGRDRHCRYADLPVLARFHNHLAAWVCGVGASL